MVIDWPQIFQVDTNFIIQSFSVRSCLSNDRHAVRLRGSLTISECILLLFKLNKVILIVVGHFCKARKARFPMLRSQAKRIMCQFGSTYICEQVFSILNLKKNNLRKKITDDHLGGTIRIATTKVIPNLQSIIQRKQLLPIECCLFKKNL